MSSANCISWWGQCYDLVYVRQQYLLKEWGQLTNWINLNDQVISSIDFFFFTDEMAIFQDFNAKIHVAQLVKEQFRKLEVSFLCIDHHIVQILTPMRIFRMCWKRLKNPTWGAVKFAVIFFLFFFKQRDNGNSQVLFHYATTVPAWSDWVVRAS